MNRTINHNIYKKYKDDFDIQILKDNDQTTSQQLIISKLETTISNLNNEINSYKTSHDNATTESSNKIRIA